MAAIVPTGKGPENVLAALKTASERTGVGFDYLMTTATRESSLNPSAKAKTSSATGLFQFIDQTWLDTVKRFGAKHGLKDVADAITRGPGGRYAVEDPAAKQDILALRKDPETAALMAAELTRDGKTRLEASLGRPVSDGELYVAHFLGVTGARELLQAADKTPDAKAAGLFPAAARANKTIFYDKGVARSVTEVVEVLTEKHEDGATAFSPPTEMATLDPATVFAPVRPWSGSVVLTPTVVAALNALDRSWLELSILDDEDR